MVCRLICDVSEGVVDKYVLINSKYKYLFILCTVHFALNILNITTPSSLKQIPL